MRIRVLALICSFSVILSTVLAGCGGGGGDAPPGAAADDTSDAATRQALQTTNLGVAPAGMLKRWNLLIPVKTKGDARAVQAMDAIEGRLGATIFDRTSIAGTPDDDITRGVVISVGTAP